MRTVATYSLTRDHSSSEQAIEHFIDCRSSIEDWLRWKGAVDIGPGQREVKFHDGRIAHLTGQHTENESGTLSSFVLREPINEGQFETRLEIAASSEGLVFFCQLRTESNEAALVPTPFEVHCPHVVRQVVKIGGWKSGTSIASGSHHLSIGKAQGEQLISEIWDPGRGLPVVTVSHFEGKPLMTNIARELAYDLAGLAIVVEIDQETSWLLSEAKGRDWSCYAGAVRLYWPFKGRSGDPYRHPLWTRTNLHWGGLDSFAAAKRLKNRLHRWVFSQSTFQPRPQIIELVRGKFYDEQRSRARDADDFLDLAESYELENQNLNQTVEDYLEQIKGLQEQIEDLRAQNRELAFSRLWSEGTGTQAESAPGEELYMDEDSTIEDAVEYAKSGCANLRFGTDVDKGISGLARQAGPPGKVLRYLWELNEMTHLLNEDALGMPMRQWLYERGVSVSGESETTGGSAAQMSKRTWDDSFGEKKPYYYHLKPSDGTSPDRCVRIYFEYEKDSARTIVGWIGRHPE